MRGIENELERGTQSSENRDSVNGYFDKWLKMINVTVADRIHLTMRVSSAFYFRPTIGKERPVVYKTHGYSKCHK